MNKRFSTIFKIDLLASQVFCSKITAWAEKGVLPCLFQAEPFPVAILGQEKRNVVLPLATDPSPKNKTTKLGSGMHLIFVRLGVFHFYSEIPREGNTSFLFLALKKGNLMTACPESLESSSIQIIQRFSRAGPRGRGREWATLGVHPLSWLLSNNRLEEVCSTLTKGTFSSRLLLSNQVKECSPSVAHSLPLPLGPALLNLSSIWSLVYEPHHLPLAHFVYST